MSENTVTFDNSRVMVSDMAVKRSNDPLRTPQSNPDRNAETKQSPVSETETLRIDREENISTPSVTFVVDQDSGKSFIQVVDRDSGEILRQIPPEEARRLSEALEELSGNVVDTLA